MRYTFIIAAILAVILPWVTGCEENDLVEGVEPYFKIRFINQDSLTSLNSYINQINGEIKHVNDSLNEIEDREGGGDETDYTEAIDALNQSKDSLNSEKVFYNNVIKTVNSGKIQLNRLIADGGIGEIRYGDSATMYSFPINFQSDSSRYFVSIGDETDTIAVQYERTTVVEERKVTVKAYNFAIKDHSFDDLKISQPDSTNYSSDEATVTVYF